MFQKLLIFLKETDSKLLIKYDGERVSNKYTIKIIYNDFNLGSLGKDSDEPYKVIQDIFENQDLFPVDDALSLYSEISDIIVRAINSRYGIKSIISIMLKVQYDHISYNYHVQTEAFTKRGSALSLNELNLSIINN